MKKEVDFTDGRRGPVIRRRGKTRITIYFDDDVLEAFRERADEAGLGYQTLMNQALREYLSGSHPLDEDTLRRVLQEEVIRELNRLWDTAAGTSRGQRWSREEIHQRS